MGLKERLGLTETVYVGVGLDRKRMRPPPGTMIVEMVDSNGRTLAVDTVEASSPAPRGPFKLTPRVECTFVEDGPTGHAHQAFQARLDEDIPLNIPDHLLAKRDVGAEFVRIWWSCET